MTIEQKVIDLVEEFNGISIFTFKRYKITLNTELYKDFKMAPEDAIDLLEKYCDQFSIDPKQINFAKYFPNEGSFLLPNILIPKEIRPTGQKSVPLTVRMLVESAKADRWLYD